MDELRFIACLQLALLTFEVLWFSPNSLGRPKVPSELLTVEELCCK